MCGGEWESSNSCRGFFRNPRRDENEGNLQIVAGTRNLLCGEYRILIMFAQHESDMFWGSLRFRRYQQNSRNSKGNSGGV